MTKALLLSMVAIVSIRAQVAADTHLDLCRQALSQGREKIAGRFLIEETMPVGICSKVLFYNKKDAYGGVSRATNDDIVANEADKLQEMLAREDVFPIILEKLKIECEKSASKIVGARIIGSRLAVQRIHYKSVWGFYPFMHDYSNQAQDPIALDEVFTATRTANKFKFKVIAKVKYDLNTNILSMREFGTKWNALGKPIQVLLGKELITNMQFRCTSLN